MRLKSQRRNGERSNSGLTEVCLQHSTLSGEPSLGWGSGATFLQLHSFALGLAVAL